MRNEENLTWKQKLKKRLPLLIFLTLSTAIFFLASSNNFGSSLGIILPLSK